MKPVCYRSHHGCGERLWRCTREDFPYNPYTNPIGYGINASEALADYIRKIT